MRGWVTLVALAMVGCSVDPGVRGGDGGRDAALLDGATIDGASLDGGSLDGAIASPDPACLVPDVGGTIELVPAVPTAGVGFRARTSDPTALTNVALRVCSPSGVVDATIANVTGSYVWEWNVPALPAGESQLVFTSDPDGAVRATARVVLEPAAPGDDAGVATPPLCAWPAGSLLDGQFEEGLVDGVPAGWQVRDPATRAACGDGHLSLTTGPEGCGTSLVIDALGSWDCWAIQRFTDHGSILGGHRYRVSAAVRSEGQDNPAAWFVVGLQWLDASDAVFGDEKNPPLADVNYDYTVVSWELVAPPEARRAVVWLSAHYPGRVTYDEVALVPLD